MAASFGGKPDFKAFAAITPAQPLDELNTKSSPMAAQSAKMNLSEVDKAPEQQLNEAIWQSVKGAGSRPPAPTHLHSAAIKEND
jgi:hypothetical protein